MSARHLVEKVRLILIFVCRTQKIIAVVARLNAAVMTCGDIVRAQLARMFGKRGELYFAVAKHVGIGRSALFVFFQKVSEHPVVVFPRKIHPVIWNIQHAAYAAHVVKIFVGGAGSVLAFFHPIAHKKPDHLVALLFKKICRNGAVHAAAQSHNDFLHTHIITQKRGYSISAAHKIHPFARTFSDKRQIAVISFEHDKHHRQQNAERKRSEIAGVHARIALESYKGKKRRNGKVVAP